MPFREDLKPDRLVALEEEVLALWEKEKTFERVLAARAKAKQWVFYEGPPTANGKPGLHHVLSRAVKDLACRWKTMQGFLVERKGGWDTHGLPVEIEVEKKLGLTGKKAIEDLGIARFNALCRESVFGYLDVWNTMTRRMGYWVDLERPYITCSREYVESLWWILAQFHARGLLYRGHKVVPYCPRCATPLSSHEVGQGFRDVQDPSVFVRFEAAEGGEGDFLVWTTTPWTLPSNVALAVHPDVDYVLVETTEGQASGARLWLAEARLPALGVAHTVVRRAPGRDLVGQRYRRLVDWYPLSRAPGPTPPFSVVAGEFVTTSDGTGVVHIAPAYGQDDHDVGKREGLPTLHPVDAQGRFLSGSPVAGQFVKDADKEILKRLKEQGSLWRRETVVHTYPHCWRCESPLLYYARDSWYVKTTALKDQMLAFNRATRWFPPAVGEGRFGQWLENNVDWAISRDRYWGTPLPLWVCGTCNTVEAVGSDAELTRRAGRRVEDLHRPFVDEVTWPCVQMGCTGVMQRTPEVADVWFDSGSMPFAQHHYPFENQAKVEREHPAEFVAEAVDQTRGWFYSLLAVSTLLVGKPATKSVACMELILDAQGKKMSKSRGNVVEPLALMQRHGADPVRWQLLARPMWVPIRYDEKDLLEIRNRFFGTLLNCYTFLATYANVDGWQPGNTPGERPVFDRWLRSRLHTLVRDASADLEDLETGKFGQRVTQFVVEDLSNWYVRRNRRRFFEEGLSDDKCSAYAALHAALVLVARLCAPLIPFVTDALHRALAPGTTGAEAGVHLAEWPKPEVGLIDPDLEQGMEGLRRICSLGHAARQKAGVNVRQPLARLSVWRLEGTARTFARTHADVVRDELNVKDLVFLSFPPREIRLKAVLDKKEAARRLGPRTPAVAAALEHLLPADVALMCGVEIPRVVTPEGDVELRPADLRVVVESDAGVTGEFGGGMLVLLETTLTPALVREGIAREIVRRVNDLRKTSGLRVEDRIALRWHATGEAREALRAFGTYVAGEVLAVRFDEAPSADGLTALDLAGHAVAVSVEKV